MSNVKKNVELKRVNINLPLSLVEKVKEFASSVGINTTSAYIVLLNQALDYKNTTDNIPLMLKAYNDFVTFNAKDKDKNTLYGN